MTRILFFFCLILLFFFSSSSVWAQNRFILEAGILEQYLPLDQSYGDFLKRRYGTESLTLSGTLLSGGFRPRTWKKSYLGLELSSLEGKIKYKNLNGTSQENLVELSHTIISFNYFFLDSLVATLGVGTNNLKRTFYGYQSTSINSGNYLVNADTSISETEGSLTMVQLSYSLSHLLKSHFGVVVGYRNTESIHEIPSTDSRPALTEKGVRTSSEFSLGGSSYFLNLALAF